MEARDKPMLVHRLDKILLRVVMMLRRNLTAVMLGGVQNLYKTNLNCLQTQAIF